MNAHICTRHSHLVNATYRLFISCAIKFKIAIICEHVNVHWRTAAKHGAPKTSSFVAPALISCVCGVSRFRACANVIYFHI
jgi:hypothetical protein